MEVDIDDNCRWIRKCILSALPLHCYLALGAYQVCCTCGAAGWTHTQHLYLCGPGFHLFMETAAQKACCALFLSAWYFVTFFLMSMSLNWKHDSGNLNISPVEVSDPWAVQQSNIQSNIFSYTVYDYFLAALHLPNPCFESFTWLVITFVWPLPYFG